MTWMSSTRPTILPGSTFLTGRWELYLEHGMVVTVSGYGKYSSSSNILGLNGSMLAT